MKMVKSLLLGTAAAMVVASAGQAAELPVKARPVQYVKVCSLYGAGFYYMPGTNMCLKVGGWMRTEFTDESNGSLSAGPYNANTNTRATNDFAWRARGYITADAREETEYGVARAYIDVGVNTDFSAAGVQAFSSNRAFMQWAGFTAGVAVSPYDAVPWAVYNYRAGYEPNENTGDAGTLVFFYTAQLGNGVSASFGMEERRDGQIFNGSAIGEAETATELTSAYDPGAGYGGQVVPDFTGNIRVDQAWGYAQVMGAAHEDRPLYYGALETSGHPSSVWGFGVGGAIKINLPMISRGDNAVIEATYADGATKYVDNTPILNKINVQGGTEGYGFMGDCVFDAGTSCHQTTNWGVIGAYEHYWTPQWHQDIVGSYMKVNYDSTANGILCQAQGNGAVGAFDTAAAGCNNDWSYWTLGSRLQWDVTKSFYIGVEAMYQNLDSASFAGGIIPGKAGLGAPTLCSTGTCSVSDEHNWAFTLRVHKDFLP
jgi:hypothetical protein